MELLILKKRLINIVVRGIINPYKGLINSQQKVFINPIKWDFWINKLH